MKKIVLPLLLFANSSCLLAQCNFQEKEDAIALWEESFHQDFNFKLTTLNKAYRKCPLNRIQVDKNIILGQAGLLDEEQLRKLNRINSGLDDIPTEHKVNNSTKINKLLGINTKKNSSMKSLDMDGGEYEANLLFAKNSSTLEDSRELRKLLNKMKEVLENNSEVGFIIEGGTSSEGNALYNERLAKERAEALKERIPYQYQSRIKIFSNGETQLVCEDELLPERNQEGEYQCPNREDKEASRHVTIRRDA